MVCIPTSAFWRHSAFWHRCLHLLHIMLPVQEVLGTMVHILHVSDFSGRLHHQLLADDLG